MTDILLELPDELIAAFEVQANRMGTTTEALMREAIKAAAPRHSARKPKLDLSDEAHKKAAEIEKEAGRLGCELGWRFIACPQRNAASSKLLLVTLNPGGRLYESGLWSQEAGSAYRVESWGRPAGENKLQRQIQRLFQFLALRDEEVFSAYYVPFRSPDWKSLIRKVEAKDFSWNLWQWLLPRVSFEAVVCLGKDMPTKAVVALLNAKLERSVEIGWGKQTGDRYRLPDGRSLIALPHLSHFPIFGREESTPGLKELFERV